MLVHITSPVAWKQVLNLVGSTTVPVKLPSGPAWTATLPPLKDQTPSIPPAAEAAAGTPRRAPIRTRPARRPRAWRTTEVFITASTSHDPFLFHRTTHDRDRGRRCRPSRRG